MGDKRPLVLVFFLVATLGACQGNAAIDFTPGEGRSRVVASSGRVECAGACRAELFDGNTLRPLTVTAAGGITVPVPVEGGERLLFVTGPGQVPQVRAVGPGRAIGLVRLQPAPDPRQGYLAAAVVRVAAGGTRLGGLHLEPFVGVQLLVDRDGERVTAVTDQGGAVVLPLAPGSYEVSIAGLRRQVEVPQGGTAVLPLVLARRMVD